MGRAKAEFSDVAFRKQARHESTDAWPQLRLALVWPE
jgi:hypothetical protein